MTRSAQWRAGGDREICPVCFQLYACEEEYRCSVCDTALCPFCVCRTQEPVACDACARDGD